MTCLFQDFFYACPVSAHTLQNRPQRPPSQPGIDFVPRGVLRNFSLLQIHFIPAKLLSLVELPLSSNLRPCGSPLLIYNAVLKPKQTLLKYFYIAVTRKVFISFPELRCIDGYALPRYRLITATPHTSLYILLASVSDFFPFELP